MKRGERFIERTPRIWMGRTAIPPVHSVDRTFCFFAGAFDILPTDPMRDSAKDGWDIGDKVLHLKLLMGRSSSLLLGQIACGVPANHDLRLGYKLGDHMNGVFTLRTSRDLLEKLTHDYELLNDRRDDPYRAFNFFVTAEHMLDWVHPGYANESSRRQERDSEVLLQICSHLASGAKHFVAEARHHDSVAGTVMKRPTNPLAGPFGGPFVPKVGPSGLYVNLDGNAKNSYGASIQVVALAERVLDYWKKHQAFVGTIT